MRTRPASRTKLALLPASLLTAAVVAAAGCASGSAPAHTSPHTTVVTVSPVTSGGAAAAGYRTITTATNASCEPGSEAIGQAYRCFADNSVYDPCWAERATTPAVLCVQAPWERTTARLAVSAALPAIPPEGSTAGEPWGVQLTSGQRCLLAQGAHGVFRGRVIDYYCTARLSLLRGLTRTGPLWTAQAVIISASGTLSAGPRVQIITAWYGRPDRTR